jgi:hypothetical protein
VCVCMCHCVCVCVCVHMYQGVGSQKEMTFELVTFLFPVSIRGYSFVVRVHEYACPCVGGVGLLHRNMATSSSYM